MPDIPAGRFALEMIAFVVVLVGFPILTAGSGIELLSAWFYVPYSLLSLLPWLLPWLALGHRPRWAAAELPRHRNRRLPLNRSNPRPRALL